MKYILLRSFVKKFDTYSKKDQESITSTIEEILLLVNTNQAPYGLRIKKLSKKIYEARINIHLRIAFFIDADVIKFFCLGNHNDIKNVLKIFKKE